MLIKTTKTKNYLLLLKLHDELNSFQVYFS